ncbi:MAG: hypothetical protein HYY20_12600, partial [Candidatus Tectomicrobia bacterium]|nr:hypothetical protein [Candidatus Tectomicrobia bacterium]
TFRFLAHPGRDLSVWDDPGAPLHGSSGGALRPEGPEDPASRSTSLPPGESGGETPLADVASLVFRFRSMVREETSGLCSLRGELPMGLLRELHGLEVENGNQTIDRAGVKAFARHRGLLLLSNSDAHSLSDIGNHYTETSLEELCAHAR